MALKKSTKTGAAKYKYRERDADSVKKRAEQDGGAFDSIFKSGIDTWRVKVGENLFRFIPPTWEDPDHYGYDVWVHGYVGADNGSYLCPQKMLNKKCPICAAAKEAADAGETDEAKALKAVKKVAAWIIDRDEDNPTPCVFLMSWTMDRDIAALCHNKRTGKVLMIDNPETGYDVTLKRVGAGLKTRYFGQAIDRDPSPMMDDQKDINKIMEYVEENPIPSILAYKDAEYLQGVVDGTVAKKDDDDEEEETTPKKRRRAEPEEDEEEEKPTKRRRAEPDEDEEERPAKRRRAEPEEDEEEEEEEEKRPAKRKRAEPEEDEEEEEEEEEEKKPVKRRRAEPEEEERPAKRKRAEPEPEEEEEEERPVKRRRAEPEEEKPAKRRRAEPEEEEEEEEERPVRRRR